MVARRWQLLLTLVQMPSEAALKELRYALPSRPLLPSREAAA